MDISVDACLLRTPLEESWRMSIYQHVSISFSLDEFNIKINGEVYRIGHDRTNPDSKDTVLVMIKFDSADQQDKKFLEMIDELEKRW